MGDMTMGAAAKAAGTGCDQCAKSAANAFQADDLLADFPDLDRRPLANRARIRRRVGLQSEQFGDLA